MSPTETPEEQKPKRQKSGWSEERRARHRLAMRSWAPWTKSTGPRTAEGKAISSMNAWKHGYYARPYQMIRDILRAQRNFLAHYIQRKKSLIRDMKQKNRNELLKAPAPASSPFSAPITPITKKFDYFPEIP